MFHFLSTFRSWAVFATNFLAGKKPDTTGHPVNSLWSYHPDHLNPKLVNIWEVGRYKSGYDRISGIYVCLFSSGLSQSVTAQYPGVRHSLRQIFRQIDIWVRPDIRNICIRSCLQKILWNSRHFNWFMAHLPIYRNLWKTKPNHT